jgi:uncharacterized linocin/CFP29 family protein
VELRADFQLSMTELRDADRGADDTDLEPLDKAAHQIAAAENIAVFHGWQGALSGIGETSPHEPIAVGDAADRYPQAVAGAVERLLQSGIGGPYGLAVGSAQYRLVIQTTEHRRVPAAEAPAQDRRGADRVDPRRDRSDRGQPERRRLHLRLRPRPVDRI